MHNTGLGDHILMSGAVRHLLSYYDIVRLVVFKRKVSNVKYLFRDEPRIQIWEEPDALTGKHAQRKAKTLRRNHAKEGWETRLFFYSIMKDWPYLMERAGLDKQKDNWHQLFYQTLDVDFHHRYESFYIERNHEREDEIYKKVIQEHGKDYSFVCKKTNKGFRDLTFSDKEDQLPKIIPDHFKEQTLLFDWMKVIEKAKIIHTIDTSWMHLIKSMRLKPENRIKVFHRYVRDVPANNGDYINDKWDNGWIDLKKRIQQL